MSKKQVWLILALLPLSAASFIGARRCQRASWPHHDAIYGTGQGPAPRGASTDAHRQDLGRLNFLADVLMLSSILALAAALCVPGWGAHASFVAVCCLFGGLVLLGMSLFEGLSLMDVSVAEQRKGILPAQILSVGAWAALLACGALASLRMRSWKRIGGVVLLILAAYVLLSWTFSASP